MLPELRATKGLSSPGMKLHGDGFILNRRQANSLGYQDNHRIIKPYLNNRDIKSRPRGLFVIDCFGFSEDKMRTDFPQIYQHLLTHVKPERSSNARQSYKESWWLFGEPRATLRPALESLEQIIATGETSRHRFFEFFDIKTVADNMIRVISSDDPFHLGTLSAHIHTVFSIRRGGWMGVGNDPRYQAECFTTFPFPAATDAQRATIGALAEELDALRKRVIAEHEFLTMTRLYNVRERIAALEAFERRPDPGRAAPPPLDEGERAIYDKGCVGVIHDLHTRIDAAVAEAYGWPADLSDEAILERLVALNRERAEEEANGLVRWLRPDYQIPRFGGGARRREQQLEADFAAPVAAAEPPLLPKEDDKLVEVVRRTLRARGRPTDTRELAQTFRNGGRSVARVERALRVLAAIGLARRTEAGWFAADHRR